MDKVLEEQIKASSHRYSESLRYHRQRGKGRVTGELQMTERATAEETKVTAKEALACEEKERAKPCRPLQNKDQELVLDPQTDSVGI